MNEQIVFLKDSKLRRRNAFSITDNSYVSTYDVLFTKENGCSKLIVFNTKKPIHGVDENEIFDKILASAAKDGFTIEDAVKRGEEI